MYKFKKCALCGAEADLELSHIVPKMVMRTLKKTAVAFQFHNYGALNERFHVAKAETEQVNHTELVTALDILIGAQQSSTKYKALNLQTNITIEQKKVLERVFDIICIDESMQSNELVTKIIREFVPKPVAILR